MRWIIARHGQTEWNKLGKSQGHTDVPLDETGRWQSQLLGSALKGEQIDFVWSSDLARARETAEIAMAANHLTLAGTPPLEGNFKLTPLLRERCFGDWEGTPYSEVKEKIAALQDAGHNLFELKAPNGESLNEVGGRMQQFVSAARQPGQTVLVVSHGGACAVLLSLILQGDIRAARNFRFANCAFSEVHETSAGKILMRHNVVEHLQGEVLQGSIHGSRE